jgi:gliding motility-associated-like protein
MARFRIKEIFLLLLFIGMATMIHAQITSTVKPATETPDGIDVFIFCTITPGTNNGYLEARPPLILSDSSTFTWERYDTLVGFVPFDGYINLEDSTQSIISRLVDGLYRVTINSRGSTVQYQAWVFNNWIKVTKAEIPDSSSTCDGFQIWADYQLAPLYYYNTVTNEKFNLRSSKKPFFEWYQGSESVSPYLNAYITPPIASWTPLLYELTVTDEFKCEGKGNVEYISKVPKSDFTADPIKGEAVLKVTFTDNSVNYDSILWCFYKRDSLIKVEIDENPGKPIDSIDFVLYGNAPVYEYEWCGIYKVKLVTVHVNPTTGNCYDTLYMKDPIDVENSLVEVPNVFTPNGDEFNNEFVVKTKSLKSMSIHIYNRWGGLVHSWSYSNIRGRDYTYIHSVWDGKIGGRMASPGVYFYVVRAVGRDGAKQNKNGFVHLFRDKN